MVDDVDLVDAVRRDFWQQSVLGLTRIGRVDRGLLNALLVDLNEAADLDLRVAQALALNALDRLNGKPDKAVLPFRTIVPPGSALSLLRICTLPFWIDHEVPVAAQICRRRSFALPNSAAPGGT